MWSNHLHIVRPTSRTLIQSCLSVNFYITLPFTILTEKYNALYYFHFNMMHITVRYIIRCAVIGILLNLKKIIRAMVRTGPLERDSTRLLLNKINLPNMFSCTKYQITFAHWCIYGHLTPPITKIK
ncbi:hypothetical protein QTP88_015139 [Uroleucon formosanum]